MAKSLDLKETLRLFVDIRKEERLKILLLFSWSFLFICCYYVLRPVRRGMVLDGLGNDSMPFVYMGTALVTALVVWVYSKFTHVPRKKLIGTIYGIFFVNLLAWWEIFQFEAKIASGLFWIWLDVFSIMGVTLFWMYANDVFDSSRAKSLFGVLAAGGGLGAVLGSSITAACVSLLGTTNMLLVAAGIVALTMGIFLILESINQAQPVRKAVGKEFEKCDTSQFSKVIATIFGNRLLLFLVLVVCFERTTPDLVQFLYNDVLKHMASGRDAITALDANLERWRGIAEFAVELTLVSMVLKKFGTTFCLSSSGALILTGLVCFAFVPNPLIIIGVFHSDEAVRHAWFKAAKELTYTVTSRDVLYSVKPVIEMFFYRFSRGFAGVMIYCVNTLMGFGSTGVLVVGSAAALGWMYCGWKLSREYQRLEMAARLDQQLEAESTKPAAGLLQSAK